jgi:hypothetical protein
MGLFDYFFNVVRNFSDLMHILTHLFIIIFFLILSLYKFDKNLYSKHIYSPFIRIFKDYLNFLWENFFSIIFFYASLIFQLYAPSSIRLASNRLPYYVIAIRNKSKTLYSKTNETKQKIKNFFKKKQ